LKERTLAIALSFVLVGATVPAPARANNLSPANPIQHVLLISIDGMHAVDYENCVASQTCPHLAALGRTGAHYTRTTTSRPSHSFPGLMALVTGGSPRTAGAFYVVAYDRVLAPPKDGNGLPGGPCNLNVINGTQTEYEEGNEIDQTMLNGGFPGSIDGGVKSINPDRLVRDPFNNCKAVYSWNFVRTNTIFGVILLGWKGASPAVSLLKIVSISIEQKKQGVPGLGTPFALGTEKIRFRLLC